MRNKGWNQRRGVALLPTAISLHQDGLAVVFQMRDEGFGRGGFLMMPGPNEKLQQNGSKSNSLGGKPVVRAAPVALHRFGNQNAGGFKLVQTVRENVGGNALARTLELTKRAVAAHHHVANDQQ